MALVELKKQNSIATITINKPEAMNALSTEVLKALASALSDIKEDKELRCAIITGEGDRAFVAGADIKEIDSLNSAKAHDFAGFGQQVFLEIENLPIPVIAAVNGFALGGGLELALACDFILASEKAKFGLPECTLGLMPGFGGSVRLSRAIGPGMAKQMTFTGDMIDAKRAKEVGLVNEVHPPAELLEAAGRVAKTVTHRAPIALDAIKRTIHKTYGMEIKEAMAMEQKEFSELFESKDCKEGTQAFIEKRKPQFTGN